MDKPKAKPLFVLCPGYLGAAYMGPEELRKSYGVVKRCAVQSPDNPLTTMSGLPIDDTMIKLFPTLMSPAVKLSEMIADMVAPGSEEACLELAADLLSLEPGDSAWHAAGLGTYIGTVDDSVIDAAYDLLKSHFSSIARMVAKASGEAKMDPVLGMKQAQELMGCHGRALTPMIGLYDLLGHTEGLLGGDKLAEMMVTEDIARSEQIGALIGAIVKYQKTFAGTNGSSWDAYVEKVCTFALQDLRDKFLYPDSKKAG